MAATTYDSLLPFISTEVNEAPYPTAISAINFAVRRLCLESSCWFDYEDVSLMNGVSDYEVSPPSASSIARNIKSVMYKGRELTPVAEYRVAKETPWLLSNTGAPTHYYVTNDGVHVMPTPTQSEAGSVIRVKTSFVPALDAKAADASLIDRFAETIIAGAKAKLMGMVGTVWENQPAAAHYQAEFERGIALVRIDTETSRSMSGLSVNRRVFGK